MTAYDRMIGVLSAVRLYDPQAPNLSAELHAYADELDRLFADLEVALPERFSATAEDRGLRAYEELFGPARGDLGTEERRRRLGLRLKLGGGDFTPAGIRKALDSFGLAYQITEFPLYDRVNIIAQTDYSKAQQSFIKRETAKIIPAHIEYQLVFNTLTWSELDQRDKTFAALDHDNLTWEQFDALTE